MQQSHISERTRVQPPLEIAMQLSPATTAIFALGITNTLAFPSPLDSFLLDTRPVALRRQDETVPVPPLGEKDKLVCNGGISAITNTAYKSSCDNLVKSLMENEVRTQPRSHCVGSDYFDNQCCVSWGKEVPRGTLYSELKVVVQHIMSECDKGPDYERISGQHTKAKLGPDGTEIKVCLSDRPTGC